MKYLKGVVDDFLEKLINNGKLSDIKSIKIYENEPYDTFVSTIYVAVSLLDVDVSDTYIGDNTKSGKYKIGCSIYVPKALEASKCKDVLCEIATTVFDYNLISLSASPITFDEITRAYLLECAFTFNDEINFGDRQ